jgi:MYXO-CTERM domain-containing protein
LLTAAGAVTGLGLVQTANAQFFGAPASAQVWEVRFVVDSTGAFAAGETATAVGITIEARVGIRPNSSAFGTANFGVSRVGGGEGTFFMTFADPAGGPLVSNAQPGPTGEGVDDNGDPLAGHFRAFRGAFSNDPPFVGSNESPFNGIFDHNPAGNATVTSVVGSRANHYDGTPLGVATLDADGNITGGDFALVYRMLFIPKPAASRTISLSWDNLSVRYLFQINGENALASTAISPDGFTNGSVSFRVPTPGAAALMGLAGLAALRRKRS